MKPAMMRSITILALLALSTCADPPAGKSLVIITLDTVRADHLGAYGYPLDITPAIDALAARGIVFDRAYAPMPQTLPSHATLFTGQPPRAHGALENAHVLSDEADMLAERLAALGYRTGAFIGALVLEQGTGMEQGFEVFDQPTGVARDASHPVERRAAAVTDAAIAWSLDGVIKDAPYMLWVHYYDAHGPFEPPEVVVDRKSVRPLVEAQPEFAGLSQKETTDYAQLWYAYANEIAAVDREVGRLLKGLQVRDLLKDAIVVVVGDHGEGLMEHEEKSHGVSVFEELMRVPLIVTPPEGTTDPALVGRRVQTAVALQDLLPMIWTMAGLPDDGMHEPGVLAAVLSGGEPPARPVFLERPHYDDENPRWMRAFRHAWGFGVLAGVVVGDEKLVRYPDGRQEYFDLAADPHELCDRAMANPQAVGRLGAMLDDWLASNPVSDPDVEISPERQATLEALGYLGGKSDEGGAPPAVSAEPGQRAHTDMCPDDRR